MLIHRAWWVAGLVVGAILFGARWSMAQDAAPAAESGKVRIGVYDSRAVALASRNSGLVQRKMVQLQKQLAEAEQAGNAKRAREIKDRGQAMQVLAHMQVFSNAPIDTIIEQIHEQLPAIAEQQRVVAILPRVDFAADGVEIVDVTDALVAAFTPDEKTLTTIAAIRKRPPIDIVDALLIKD